MNVDVHALNIDRSDTLAAHVRDRISSALERFQQRVRRVRVRLSDLNGPRGGEDMMCQMQVDVMGCGLLIVEQTDTDVYHAVDQAAERVKRTVRRAINKKRDAATRNNRSAAYKAMNI
ncbi:HPF/RaiA family ribosome-associated protein [Mucisphaera calidilacus]|uniref:Ribosome hibernation promoting factor n=1 Tax=Mucisphaera calidilacus TaxID=2527982 RepID=A0A518BZ04_9BACT|nr:HPF/RaiA family ribosome-associated protein [Mucisphaera calidilacus]QDU72203.1 Sigma 54 modulation protein / S30EA ribosomal protein [Mucisphaera calidilacus]